MIDRAWEYRRDPKLRGVGFLEDELYDPGTWVSSSPAYVPLYVADRIDKFWGSKILIKFKREHIRAAVDSARLTDPRAADFLVERLIARQRTTARYWFERVNPLDEFAFADGTLCFEDLSIVYGFASASATRYGIATFDRVGRPLAAKTLAAGGSGVTCTSVGLSSAKDGYTIVRADTERPGFSGTTYVHLARDPASGTARVIGIWRP